MYVMNTRICSKEIKFEFEILFIIPFFYSTLKKNKKRSSLFLQIKDFSI